MNIDWYKNTRAKKRFRRWDCVTRNGDANHLLRKSQIFIEKFFVTIWFSDPFEKIFKSNTLKIIIYFGIHFQNIENMFYEYFKKMKKMKNNKIFSILLRSPKMMFLENIFWGRNPTLNTPTLKPPIPPHFLAEEGTLFYISSWITLRI